MDDELPPLPADVEDLVEHLNEGLVAVLGDSFVSFFLYGALAFPRPPEWIVDVDFHVFVDTPTTGAQRLALHGLHAHLAASHPLGRELDGYYVALSDARGRSKPRNQFDLLLADEAWALHRGHVRAGRMFLITGVDPRDIVVAPDWDELVDGLRAELAFIETHPQHAAFGILNACRISCSTQYRDVVISKYAAAQWARDALPDIRHAVDAAQRAYLGASRAADDEVLRAAWPHAVAQARRAIEAAVTMR